MSKRALLHRGLFYRRVEADRANRGVTLETAFADEWEKENEPVVWRNYGHGILQDMLFGHWDRSRVCRLRWDYWFDRPWARFVIRRRDAAIAATVVQWLGSNCGFSFLERVLELAGYEVMTTERADELRARLRSA